MVRAYISALGWSVELPRDRGFESRRGQSDDFSLSRCKTRKNFIYEYTFFIISVLRTSSAISSYTTRARNIIVKYIVGIRQDNSFTDL